MAIVAAGRALCLQQAVKDASNAHIRLVPLREGLIATVRKSLPPYSDACSLTWPVSLHAAVCREGYYRRPGPVTSTATCSICPPEAICEWNTTVESLQVRPGHWRLSALTSSIYRCGSDDLSTRAGLQTTCSGGQEVGQAGDGYCLNGTSGFRCQVCSSDDYHFDDELGLCQSCGDVSRKIGLLIASTIFAALCLFVAYQLIVRLGVMKYRLVKRWLRPYKALQTLWMAMRIRSGKREEVGAQAKFK